MLYLLFLYLQDHASQVTAMTDYPPIPEYNHIQQIPDMLSEASSTIWQKVSSAPTLSLLSNDNVGSLETQYDLEELCTLNRSKTDSASLQLPVCIRISTLNVSDV